MAVAYQAHGSFMITSKLLVHDEYVRNCSQFSTDASSMHVLDKDIKNCHNSQQKWSLAENQNTTSVVHWQHPGIHQGKTKVSEYNSL